MIKGKKLLGVKAVGFDVDGTLYKSTEEMHDWIYNEWVGDVARYLNVSWDEAKILYDDRYKELGSNTETLNSFGLDGQAIAARLFDDIPLERYVGRDEKLVKIVSELKARYQLFIISNGTERQVRRKIEMLGLAVEDFDPVICCYDRPGWNKPVATSFLHVLDKLQIKPDEAVYVGDREETDILPAQSVGMRTVLIGKESKAATQNCATIYELEEIL